MANTFLAVEGPQDSEFIARLLKQLGFKKVSMLDELDPAFCLRLLDTKYPLNGDLYARMPTPMYMRRNEDWVAIRSAGGETPHLKAAITIALQRLRPQPSTLHSIGMIRDSDAQSADKCFNGLISAIQMISDIDGFSIQMPDAPGIVTSGSPRFGIYIFPDNEGEGTLETLLQECGDVVYPDLMEAAQTFVNGVAVDKLIPKDRELFNKPFGRQKATVA